MEEQTESGIGESIEQFIARQVESGYYASREAVIQAAVRRMMEEQEAELDYLAERIREPWEQWKRGEPGHALTLESIKQRVYQRRAQETNGA